MEIKGITKFAEFVQTRTIFQGVKNIVIIGDMNVQLLIALSTVWCNTVRKLSRLLPEDGGLYMEKIIQCFLAMVILV